MPSVIKVDFGFGDIRMWNVNVKVGAGGVTRGTDVMLSQWLMAVSSREGDNPKLSETDVVGVWGPKSTAALAAFEKRHKDFVSSDGCVDPIRPGQTKGSNSKKLYKLIALQLLFITFMIGETIEEALRSGRQGKVDIEGFLMKMPEDSNGMPGDLRLSMIRARDLGTLEL